MPEGPQHINVAGEVGITSARPTFVQRAGLWLALGVGLLIFVVTVTLVAFFWAHYPDPPPASAWTSADKPDPLGPYKALSEISTKNAIDLFHTVVTQALLPVFTAILGYIFAKGGRDGAD